MSTVNKDQKNKAMDQLGKSLTPPRSAAGAYVSAPKASEDVRRGPKKKGEYKKVTLNLDTKLNAELDKYIMQLRTEAINKEQEPPSKSEWVRDLVEKKLKELGVIK